MRHATDSNRGTWAADQLDVLVSEGAKALARQEGVSLRTLRRRFKDRGLTLAQARLTRKAAMAVNLFQGKTFNLREVAFQLGYSGPSSLCRFIRREFGVSPHILRRQLLQH
jgi:AraC-like DNA-binding protein